ncbi:hypothetical protein LguiA_002358 [Lonicera macranthoides]
MDMFVQASNGHFLPKNNIPEPARRSANYHPSIWGDRFLKYANSDCTKSEGATELQHEQLKEEVRKMIVGGSDEPAQQLKLIDAIQRLGVSYHFESEIDVALKNHLESFNDSFDKCNKINDEDDLFMVALRFRLLRQRGHHISCDVFNKFKDNEGKFKESLINDTQGLLSLYESVHLRVHEEAILDEALEFTTAHLEQMQNSLSNNALLASQVAYALNMPIRKGLTRLEGRHYIPIYQQDSSHHETLLKLAKLDFNMLQKVHQRELGDITRWDINYANQLPEYMRHIYATLLDVYKEMEEELSKEGKSYRVDYAKEGMKQLVRAYFHEANWYHKGYVPTFEEYMEVALVSGAYIMLATTSFVGMGESVTKQAFDYVSNNPLIVKASSVICRLTDDMVGHEFEQERGHLASTVECYMKQHSVTKEEVFVEFNRRITNAWKDMNQECISPTAMPMALLERVLNLAHVINLMYKDEDGFKVQVRVIDGTCSSFLLWDRECFQLIGKTASNLRENFVKAVDIGAQDEKKMLFKVQVKLQNVSEHNEVFTVIRLTDNDEFISKYASRRCVEYQDYVSENEVNTPNITPAKRSNTLIVLDDGLSKDILDVDPTTQMSSNKLIKHVKLENN